jgi:His-Xaa-Ser system protein HxsD
LVERRLSLDRSGNSLDAVQRAAYRLSDRLSCDVSENADAIEVTLHIADNGNDPDAVLADFRNEVLDQVLRERIRAETADVRNLVLAAAFSKTGLTDADV